VGEAAWHQSAEGRPQAEANSQCRSAEANGGGCQSEMGEGEGSGEENAIVVSVVREAAGMLVRQRPRVAQLWIVGRLCGDFTCSMVAIGYFFHVKQEHEHAPYGKHCFPRRRVINQLHNQMDAASLGLAICDCKERQVCRLTYAPKTVLKLHTCFKYQVLSRFLLLKSWAIAKTKRVAAQMSRTAIAMVSAVILIFILSVSISSSVRFFCLEHPGVLIVVIAVAGEVVCDWNRNKSLRERLKKLFGMLLVAGLLIEIAEAIKSDRTVASARLEIAKLKQPRTLTTDQMGSIDKTLKGTARGRVIIEHVLAGDAPAFAYILGFAFFQMGYDVSPSPAENPNLSFLVYSPPKLRRFEGVEMIFSGKQPAYGKKIEEALTNAGVPVSYTLDPNFESNKVLIEVVERP